MSYSKAWFRDALERLVWTFIQGALSALSVEAVVTGDVSALIPAAVGGLSAALSFIKSLAAKHVGDPETAMLWTSQKPPPSG